MCTRPIPIRYVNRFGIDSVVDAPCGKCFDCLRKYQNDWKVRAIEESKGWQHGYFFTLTYREDALPYFVPGSDGSLTFYRGSDVRDLEFSSKFSTVYPDDIKNHFKRWRSACFRKRAKELGITRKELETTDTYRLCRPRFSYFLCSEYGPNGTRRPHYHGLLFTDLPRSYVALFFLDWKTRFGFYKMSKLVQRKDAVNKSSAAANYVAKYCSKGCLDSRLSDIHEGLCLPCFRYVSHGFGASYLDANRSHHIPKIKGSRSLSESYIDLVLSRCHYYDGKFKYSLPRYYYERLFYEKIKRPHRIAIDKDTKRETVRYCSRFAPHNSLCDKMSFRLRAISEARYRERFENVKFSYPSWSDSEIHLYLARCDKVSRENREKTVRNNLNKFYFENKLKNKEL